MTSLFRIAVNCLTLFTIISCSTQKENPTGIYQTAGRTEKLSNGNIVLIGSASSVAFDFSGKSCSITLQSKDSWAHQAYVSLELDGEYTGRRRIEKGTVQSFEISVSNTAKVHHLVIYKATEAATGDVVFSGVKADKIQSSKKIAKKKIEFIGNSITCGMGNDTKEIPCGTGDWFDQHNAYWAYGPILSRSLNADFLLSSVSGFGMYRNWNDEHIEQAIIPDVYEKLHLNKDKQIPYDFAFQPDIVSICLGTNDLSDGDGKKPRLPFNSQKFISNYITFIKTVYKHSPKTRIVLLNSPMIGGEKNAIFVNCLKQIKAAFDNDKQHRPIALFEYKPMIPKGCNYHPDIEDHKLMAAQLEPFFKKMLDEK